MTAPIEPGLYSGVPEDVYHGGDSLSSSGARRLLEVTPHRWQWEQQHPKPPSDEMVWGSAVHSLVLGAGPTPVDTGYERWQSNDAKAEVARIKAEGGIPLKPKDFARAHDAAAKVREHPDAAALLASGDPELSAYAPDSGTGVMRRARPDWMQWIGHRTARVGDLKTSSKTGPRPWVWSAADFGYHIQMPWYADVLADLPDPVEVAEWLWLVVCSDPPYEVWIVEMPPAAYDLGRRQCRRALDIYAECRDTGIWPTHPEGVHLLDLPANTYRQEDWIR